MRLIPNAIILLLVFSNLFFAQKVSFMSYNIRVDIQSDSLNSWPNRKEFLAEQIKFYEPDIFGIQEGLLHQVSYLDSVLKNYKFTGIGRDGNEKGEYSSIFYNSKLFDLITSSTFWLSETPEQVSIGWDAALNRICTYGLFKNKSSNNYFWVFNTHLDHIGEIAREKSIKLILERIDSLNVDNFRVILMGDFNLLPNSKPVIFLSNLMNDTYNYSSNLFIESEGTFNGFNFNIPAKNRIDYIFTSCKDIKVYKYAILKDSRNSRFPSDHFPVFVEVIFKYK